MCVVVNDRLVYSILSSQQKFYLSLNSIFLWASIQELPCLVISIVGFIFFNINFLIFSL